MKKPSLENPSLPSFSSLPDDITVKYLARIPRPYYPRLSTVSKTFHSLLSSTDLYTERSRLGNTQQCLYVCLRDRNYQFSQWFMLWINPTKQTLPNEQLLVPVPPCSSPAASQATVVVGCEIYVMGGPIDNAPSSSLRILDCRTHTWHEGPSMNVSRKYASSLAHDGKIFVVGGCQPVEVEVFDIKTQIWTHFPNFINDGFRLLEFQGTVYIQTSCLPQRGFIMYAYDTAQGKWERCENIEDATWSTSECVIENLFYRCDLDCVYGLSISVCVWYDVKSGDWIEVKGLDSLLETYLKNGGFTSDNTARLVSLGEKLLFIWEGDIEDDSNGMREIWCAEIVVEKRDGDEVWGEVEWVDVVHSGSCELLNCLAVSV